MRDLVEWARSPRRVVAVCGAAVSGSESAAMFAEAGLSVIVFEQGARAYGKIEDGLPRWHERLREREYERIDANLNHPNIFFVPKTRVGVDVALDRLLDLGIPYVLLANGAQRDRPLPIPGADRFVGHGLIYQNPLMLWFNHYPEADYKGPTFDLQSGAIVVGGGLASVDVAKLINLELTQRALHKRGIEIGVVELEHAGIGPTLTQHGLTMKELGIMPTRLFYRRRVIDMPVAFPRDDSVEALTKIQKTREKLVNVLHEKFLVDVVPCQAPVAAVEHKGRLTGLRFAKTEVRDGRVHLVEGSEHDVLSETIVSSIGSVPEPMPCIPMRGDLYDFANPDTGQLREQAQVYGLGNVLTGKGNIRDSRDNARHISKQVIESYLGTDAEAEKREELMAGAHRRAQSQMGVHLARATQCKPLTPDQLRPIAALIEDRWRVAGYDGEYRPYEFHA